MANLIQVLRPQNREDDVVTSLCRKMGLKFLGVLNNGSAIYDIWELCDWGEYVRDSKVWVMAELLEHTLMETPLTELRTLLDRMNVKKI